MGRLEYFLIQAINTCESWKVAMITNEAFMLGPEELARYNEWAASIAKGHVDAEIESWELEVTFSFSNLGTDIVAHCCGADRSCDLVLRNESAWLK